MSDVRARAIAAGLSPDWQDANGRRHAVSDDALRAILDALGDGPALEPSSFASGDIGASVTIAGLAGRARLHLEDGSSRDILVDDGAIPAIDVAGYHRLEIADRTIDLAIAPRRCFTLADVAPGRRLWGPAVQIAALRDAQASAFGDFGALARAASAFASAGADALAISPTQALFPADARRYSPYAPSSRQFLNVLYADPGALAEDAGPELIDWAYAIPARLQALRAAFDASDRNQLARFRAEEGEDLERHALFDAIHAHMFAATGAQGWRDWPIAFHDPAGAAVQHFAAEHADDVAFYAYLQGAARGYLAAAQRAAIDGGMAIGLIADLAVGLDPGGSHAWSRRGDLLSGLSIGAPPDPLGPDGQNWGITGFDPRALRASGFAPFVATIRAALAQAGGLRIDHAFGLRRLWVMPEGASAVEGAYLDMPFADMMRIVALESHRARAIVIGEDLGTVPDGFRQAMDEHAMLGMRVLWFERDAEGGFVPPAAWSREAVAMTGTHDLPTVAGWWQGRDIDWTWALGRTASAPDETSDRAARATDRTRLWEAMETGAPEPAVDDSAPVVDAAIAHVGGSPCALAILPIEDLVGLVEQPNLPGTIDEHPNWRRRMPDTTQALLDRPAVRTRIETLAAARRG